MSATYLTSWNRLALEVSYVADKLEKKNMLRKLQISRFVSLKVSCVARANLCHLENKTNLELIVPLEIIYAHLESKNAAEI